MYSLTILSDMSSFCVAGTELYGNSCRSCVGNTFKRYNDTSKCQNCFRDSLGHQAVASTDRTTCYYVINVSK